MRKKLKNIFNFKYTTDVDTSLPIKLYISIEDFSILDEVLKVYEKTLSREELKLDVDELRYTLLLDSEALILEKITSTPEKNIIKYRNIFLEHGISARLTN